MSGEAQDGNARAGHGPDTNQPRKSLIIKLRVPNLYTAHGSVFSQHSKANGVGHSSVAPLEPLLNAPKRRGRPPKNAPRPANAPPPKPKSSDLPKPVATRSSKRKAAELDGDPADPGESGALNEEDFDANQPPRKKSRSNSQPPATRISTRIRGRQSSNAESTLANAAADPDADPEASELATANGHVTPTKTTEKESLAGREIPATRNSGRGRRRESLVSINDPIASIEPHESFNASENGGTGVVTRAGARTRSASRKVDAIPTAEASPAPAVITAEAQNSVLGGAEEVQSEADAPKLRGRGRWPNGALKAKNAGSAAAAATAKKNGPKKKGAPGKRKTSNDAVVQAAYDRQAHLRSSFKDLRKILIRAQQALLDRSLEELEETPDRYKKTRYYEDVMKGLDARRTKVLAQRERRDQLERDLLRRRFEANVEIAWQQQRLEVQDLQERYEAKCKREVLNLLKRAAGEEDDNASVAEVDETGAAAISAILDADEIESEDAPTPVEVEIAAPKKGRPPTVKGKRGPKKRVAEDEPLGKRVAKRHAPAMLSAITQAAEDSEVDKPLEPLPVIVTPSRQKSKYHFDDYGIYIPTEVKKGAQKEDPNNRVVVKPWIVFEKGEIGLRNYPDEIKGTKAAIPGGNIHLDQFRGVYHVSGRPEDYDQRLIGIHGLHPALGLPIPGARNPDDTAPRTDYFAVLENIAEPLRFMNEEYPEGHSTSRSWDIITAEREWKALEKRMDAGMSLKAGLGQTGLATFDAVARDRHLEADAISDILAASEMVTEDVAETQTALPSPPPKAVTKPIVEAAPPQPTPVTPTQPPPIMSTAHLSLLADASEMLQMEKRRQSPPPPRYVHQTTVQTFQPSPPTPRTRSQMPSISFINNPSPSHTALPPLAPQVSRPYAGPVMMAPPPPPPPRNIPVQYPPLQPHPPSFYGTSSPSTSRSSRSSSGLRSLLPRAMPGDGPVHPPTQHHHQQMHYQVPPPPPPQHIPPERQRYTYDAAVQLPPYLGEPYPGYHPAPPGPYPPYQPHHSPRR